MVDKERFPDEQPRFPSTQRNGRKWLMIVALVLMATYSCMHHIQTLSPEVWLPRVLNEVDSESGVCPQVAEYDPTAALDGIDVHKPSTETSVYRLSQAVQINTSVGDDWPSPDEDPDAWQLFHPYARWFEKNFPHVHDADSPVHRDVIHHHGLLYTWKGTDPSLKPLLITAHQDVVPVDSSTLSEWVHPPFSGHIDFENQTVWGRGAIDCKNWLHGSMASVESLLASGWTPRRTILIAYGFDEESGGSQGAQYIAKFLQDKYGESSVAMLVDEGTPVYSSSDPEAYGAPIAAPAVIEKGMLNVELEVRSKGGHSSMPPPHTSIGFMSRILSLLEDHPFPDKIEEKSKAHIKFLQCMRDHPTMPSKLRHALYKLEYAERLHTRTFDSLRLSKLPIIERLLVSFAPKFWTTSKLENARQGVLDVLDYSMLSLLKTTQAADVIHGGVKVNALPERVTAQINHRVATYSSIAEVQTRYKGLLKRFAHDLSLSLTAFGQELIPHTNSSLGSLSIRNGSWIVETSRPSPTEGEKAGPWRLLSSVIRQTWHLDEPRHILQSKSSNVIRVPTNYEQPVRVSPTVMFAITDTHWYNKLTDNIFRFASLSVHPDLTGMSMFHTMHTVNEHVSIDAIVKAVDFYTNLMIAASHENIENI
ncbi:Gly-Xaa carboxypeptidase [Malassezia psittaci]|uniref:Gly-Xaa carboxypeptidase n=1 Tax=Malassezia psittaci TaxID=1821823 RepID=A0AAF0JCB4_9BASI|nr:Gly-Xaa carboxypeptidase [Malassezia psittaci]